MSDLTPEEVTELRAAAERRQLRRAGTIASDVYGDPPEGKSYDEWVSVCDYSDLEVLADAFLSAAAEVERLRELLRRAQNFLDLEGYDEGDLHREIAAALTRKDGP